MADGFDARFTRVMLVCGVDEQIQGDLFGGFVIPAGSRGYALAWDDEARTARVVFAGRGHPVTVAQHLLRVLPWDV